MTLVHAEAAKNTRSAVVHKNYTDIIYYILIVVIVLIDQLTKKIAVEKLENITALHVHGGIFKLTIVKNTGAAFSILRGRQRLLKAITVPLITVLFYFLIKTVNSGGIIWQAVSLAFIIGGAVGNLIDRLRYNYVVDFISLNIRRFPVCNFADLFIAVGSILLAIYF